MTFYHFTLRVRHDNGMVSISTVATDEAKAREIVMRAEHCPASAIRRVYKGKAIN